MYEGWDAADRIAVARLDGAVSRHAGWKTELTEDELAAAVRELQEITKDRPAGPALMAEVAGLGLGARAGIPVEEDKARVEAKILVAAGADTTLIERWTRLGAERASLARQPPFGARVLGPGQLPLPPAAPGSAVPAM